MDQPGEKTIQFHEPASVQQQQYLNRNPSQDLSRDCRQNRTLGKRSCDAADITEWISQARKLFNSMKRQVFSSNNIPIDIRRRLYQGIVVKTGLLGSEAGH
jgi:hypothetical protein